LKEWKRGPGVTGRARHFGCGVREGGRLEAGGAAGRARGERRRGPGRGSLPALGWRIANGPEPMASSLVLRPGDEVEGLPEPRWDLGRATAPRFQIAGDEGGLVRNAWVVRRAGRSIGRVRREGSVSVCAGARTLAATGRLPDQISLVSCTKYRLLFSPARLGSGLAPVLSCLHVLHLDLWQISAGQTHQLGSIRASR